MKTEKPTSKQWNEYVMVASVNLKPKTSFQKLVSHHQLFWACQAFLVVFDFCFESFIKVSDNTGDDKCVCLDWCWKTSEQGQTVQTYSPLPLSKWVTRYTSAHVFKNSQQTTSAFGKPWHVEIFIEYILNLFKEIWDSPLFNIRTGWTGAPMIDAIDGPYFG